MFLVGAFAFCSVIVCMKKRSGSPMADLRKSGQNDEMIETRYPSLIIVSKYAEVSNNRAAGTRTIKRSPLSSTRKKTIIKKSYSRSSGAEKSFVDAISGNVTTESH